MEVIEFKDDYYLLDHEGQKYLKFYWHDRDFDIDMLIQIKGGEERLYSQMFPEVSYRQLVKEVAIGVISGSKYIEREIKGELRELADIAIGKYKKR